MISFIARLVVGSILLVTTTATAQSHTVILNGLSGQVLLDSVAALYRPNVVLDYANARDTLYGNILSKDDDSIRCIYSGHTLYLSPIADPTQYIYLNGSSLGLNTEHAYPQAKGAADGNARSDMHHLFPARIQVNEARGSFPFGEIPDAQTTKWFYKTFEISTIPTTNKDGYSEFKAGTFEPREVSKGDLARAIFYFYTMYKSQANIADPTFFESQRLTLCQWNNQDPVNGAEMIKTLRIAPYQDGKPNPFIIDCSLAFRTYCPNTPPNCLLIASALPAARLAVKITPQPFQYTTQLELDLPFSGKLEGIVRSVNGQELLRFAQDDLPSGHFVQPIEVENKAAGLLFLEIHLTASDGRRLSNAIPLIQQW